MEHVTLPKALLEKAADLAAALRNAAEHEDAANPLVGKKIAGLEHTAIRLVDERSAKTVSFDVTLDDEIGKFAPNGMVTAGNSTAALRENAPAPATGNAFDRMLQAELQKNAGELVKAGTILLQDNGIGSIRLVLHPEHLGNVKINLKLADGQVTGTIACASEEAYRALKETIPSLKEAFQQGGFDTGHFDLSWGKEGEGQHGGDFADQQPRPQDFALATGEYERVIPDVFIDNERYAVNMVA
jgi:flagellar hook-length control protein FliK